MNAPVRSYTLYTQEERDLIAALLKEGDTALQIAVKLSKQSGKPISRNAIIGVVHRDGDLKAIGFARIGNREKAGKKQSNPKRLKPKREHGSVPVSAFYTSPQAMPSKLYLAMTEELEYDVPAEARNISIARTPGRNPITRRQPHFAAMRFLDCLFDRCRAPLSSDLNEKPGPDMLCCGFRVGAGKPYCTYHQARLCDRKHEYGAVAA